MTQQQKVVFRLEQDEDGYPPVSYEGIWATPLQNGHMKIDNIPFYVMGISSDDEIEVKFENEEFWFCSLVKPSKNSTFRLSPINLASIKAVRAEVEKLGCKSECDLRVGLIAVEIPEVTSIHPFLDYIVDARDRDVLDFEEAALRHAL